MKAKQEAAKQINEIQGRVQDIFFELDEFKENDVASLAQSRVIELMDAITDIRNRILKGESWIELKEKE